MKPTYAGKIKNAGTQFVNALFKADQSPKVQKKEGEDLR